MMACTVIIATDATILRFKLQYGIAIHLLEISNVK